MYQFATKTEILRAATASGAFTSGLEVVIVEIDTRMKLMVERDGLFVSC